MKKIIAKRQDIAFYLKLYPLRTHPDAYWKAKSIVCSGSERLMEDNFEKKPIPKNECDTKEVDENIKFAESHGITGTPAMVMPDGSLREGTIEADRLIKLTEEAFANATHKKAQR